MVGIVIVSHSPTLAAGIENLARQMVPGEMRLAVAAGTEDPDHPIGTNAFKIQEAIEAVYSEAGVLVLVDLGSAILSAELALEFFDEAQRSHVWLCGAPLVEGALAAIVQAAAGGSLQEVGAEALGALAAKQEQIAASQPAFTAPGAPEPLQPVPVAPGDAAHGAAAAERRLTVAVEGGLHARPAAQFVNTAARFEATVEVTKAGQDSVVASGRSINSLATLGVRQGDKIVVRARGADAEEAVAALASLVQAELQPVEGHPPSEATAAAPRAASEKDVLIGIPAAPGIAVGPAVRLRRQAVQIEVRRTSDPDVEWRRLQQALEDAREALHRLEASTNLQAGAATGAIFEVHRLMLSDPHLLEGVRQRLDHDRINAEAAWQQEIEQLAAEYAALEDESLRARRADVQDVGERVLALLSGTTAQGRHFDAPSILLATELTPSDTAMLDPALVLGLCTAGGGPTSHSAILARAYGIPAVVGLGPALQQVQEGQHIAIDATAGQVWLQPAPELVVSLRAEQERQLAARERARQSAAAPAATADGQRIEVAANIGAPSDIAPALQNGAEGVGLFRTEFLFLDRQEAPTEEEQFAAYRQAAVALDGRPLIIRTLDIGGDKPLPYLPVTPEENPFLGWRGIRFCLDHPELFIPQLRALLRAAHEHDVRLMLPMVSTVAEVQAARALIATVSADLAAEGVPFDESIVVGIMIEVPAAVLLADRLAREVEFFSIGTNDLTQYVMAADRGNSHVASLANALHPALLRMVQETVEAAHSAGKWVGMCGELAGNPLAAPLLVGLGLNELSMGAAAIPAVKAAIARFTVAEAQQLAREALELGSATEVEDLLEQQQPTH